jgi:hypothetical protein
MTISLGDIRCSASQKMQTLLTTLTSHGVTDARGCVVMSKMKMDELPAGHRLVVAHVKPGFLPLSDDHQRAIQGVVAEEVLRIMEQVMPADCSEARVVAAEYRLTAPTGIVSLCVETHGLVDHVARVSLN